MWYKEPFFSPKKKPSYLSQAPPFFFGHEDTKISSKKEITLHHHRVVYQFFLFLKGVEPQLGFSIITNLGCTNKLPIFISPTFPFPL
jgi:hypothetical protein